MGLIAGSTTDPPALAYSNMAAGNDAPAVGYATVYPLTMFFACVTAQLMILFFIHRINILLLVMLEKCKLPSLPPK